MCLCLCGHGVVNVCRVRTCAGRCGCRGGYVFVDVCSGLWEDVCEEVGVHVCVCV